MKTVKNTFGVIFYLIIISSATLSFYHYLHTAFTSNYSYADAI